MEVKDGGAAAGGAPSNRQMVLTEAGQEGRPQPPEPRPQQLAGCVPLCAVSRFVRAFIRFRKMTQLELALES